MSSFQKIRSIFWISFEDSSRLVGAFLILFGFGFEFGLFLMGIFFDYEKYTSKLGSGIYFIALLSFPLFFISFVFYFLGNYKKYKI